MCTLSHAADNTVSMLGTPGRTGDCHLETDIEEFSRHLLVNLTRTGSLEQEVGVTCYTRDNSAKGNHDFVARVKDAPGSEVVFGVNQSMAECVVEIKDDNATEPREKFYVQVEAHTSLGLVYVEPTLSIMCVYINYDINDSECPSCVCMCVW